MRLIGESPIVRINEGNELVNEYMLKRAEVEAATTAAAWGAGCGAALHRRSRSASASARDVAVGHHNDEWLCLAFGNQVVHDHVGMALCAPARFIFAAAMLQLANRGTLRLILIVARRRVHEAAKVRVGALGIEVCLSQPSMR